MPPGKLLTSPWTQQSCKAQVLANTSRHMDAQLLASTSRHMDERQAVLAVGRKLVEGVLRWGSPPDAAAFDGKPLYKALLSGDSREALALLQPGGEEARRHACELGPWGFNTPQAAVGGMCSGMLPAQRAHNTCLVLSACACLVSTACACLPACHVGLLFWSVPV